MKTLVRTFLYPDCSSQVEIENVAAWCNNSEIVVSNSLYKVKASAKMVEVDGDMISYNVNVAHILFEHLLTVTVSNTSSREI